MKPALLGLTNGTTKEKSLFSRVYPISRLHPSFSPRSVPSPLRCSALESALARSPGPPFAQFCSRNSLAFYPFSFPLFLRSSARSTIDSLSEFATVRRNVCKSAICSIHNFGSIWTLFFLETSLDYYSSVTFHFSALRYSSCSTFPSTEKFVLA